MGIELLFKPDFGKKAYRLKCRFLIEAYPTEDRLKQGALRAYDWFVRDMAKEGWECLTGEGVRMLGPFSPVQPMNLHRPRLLSSRQMLPAVAQGAKFRATEDFGAKTVIPLSECESWEYELRVVFVRNTIVFDVPYPHEEMVGAR